MEAKVVAQPTVDLVEDGIVHPTGAATYAAFVDSLELLGHGEALPRKP